jgi:hypothetical protein
MGSWDSNFAAAVGSVVGREHVRLGCGGQDAGLVRVAGDRIVLVVADGCSSSASSEVGARLAAAWLARVLADEGAGAGIASIRARLIDFVKRIATELAGDGSLAGALNDYFLFGFLAAVVDAERAIVLGAGDGVIAVNDAVTAIDPGADNAPDYVAYALLDGERGALRIHHDGPTCDVRSLVIATDGALDLMRRADDPIDGARQGGLEQFTGDARYAKNPSLLRKRLAVIGALHGRLPDDTTIAVLTRRGS